MVATLGVSIDKDKATNINEKEPNSPISPACFSLPGEEVFPKIASTSKHVE